MERLYSLLALQERIGQALASSLGIDGPVIFEIALDRDGQLVEVWTHRKGKLTRRQLDQLVLPLDLEPTPTYPPPAAA